MRMVNIAPCLGRRMLVADAHRARPWDEAISHKTGMAGGFDTSYCSEAVVAKLPMRFETMAMASFRRQAGSARRPALHGAPG